MDTVTKPHAAAKQDTCNSPAPETTEASFAGFNDRELLTYVLLGLSDDTDVAYGLEHVVDDLNILAEVVHTDYLANFPRAKETVLTIARRLNALIVLSRRRVEALERDLAAARAELKAVTS